MENYFGSPGTPDGMSSIWQEIYFPCVFRAADKSGIRQAR
jgi:hypothetical protein